MNANLLSTKMDDVRAGQDDRKVTGPGLQTGIGITVCICTSGRPAELLRCLNSLAAQTMAPREVIVSDDSKDVSVAQSIQEICRRFSFVQYTEGPKRGLCANRNHVIRQATGSHVSLLDDDAVASADFLEQADELIIKHPDKIITGDVMEHGILRSQPTNSTFLGHFGRPLAADKKLQNINLNCNVIPRSFFTVAIFDERIVFGYEDSDLCARLISNGFEIAYFPTLINDHRPPGRGNYRSEAQAWQVERARFYTTLRRYLYWRRNIPALIAFVFIAPMHLALAALRRRQFHRLACGWLWIGRDLVRGRD